MSRDALVVFVGDLHVGHKAAVAPQADCATATSLELLDSWRAMTARVLKEAKGCDLGIMLGGDLIEGFHHGGHELWASTHKQQRDAAVALLTPLVNAASFLYGVRGTAAHAGDEGEDDQTVVEALGAKCANYVWRMEIAGKLLYWSHHGASSSREPQNESNGLFADAKRHYELALRSGAKPPDLVVHHHTHFAPPPVTANGITVAICPCWKGQDEHGAKIGPERTPDIGVLIWRPKIGTLERWLYPLKGGEYAKAGTDSKRRS